MRLRTLLASVALVLISAGCTGSPDGVGDGSAELYRYVIPAGTGEAIDSGEAVAIVPQRLDLLVGDTVEIVNEDTRGHNVGLFFVGVGETVSQTFRSPAEYTDACSVHPSGQFTIVVS